MDLSVPRENEVLLESLREKARLASLRAEISEAFNSWGELDSVLQSCTDALVKNLDAAFARVWVLDKSSEILELRASSGLYTHRDGPHGRVKVGDFKIGRIAKNLKPHISNTVPTDPEVSNPEWAQKEGMVAFAGYPLTMEGKALGVVAFFSKNQLSDDILNELEPIADGIAQWIKRKQAELALLEQKELLAVTLRSIGDAVVSTDKQGNVTFMNHVAETLTGWSSPEALGHPLETVFHIINEATRQKVESPVAKALRENRIVGLANHTILIKQSGDETPIDDSASPIRNSEGDVVGVILVFHDITARRQAEREREAQAEILENRVKERTAQLEETIRSLEGVSYSIAHDLRGPLRSMEAFSTALLEDCAEEISPLAHDYAARISASARRMDALIRELLAFGQLAHQEIPLEPVSVDDTVNRVLVSLEGFINEAHAQITVDHLGSVVANATVLEQAILNLLTNALKFVKDGAPPRIEISSMKRSDRLRVQVRDHGIGIPHRYIDRIFKIFERLDPKAYSGTGIGLAIVQKSVQRMGGTVGVESAQGQGSTFWIELPVSP